MTRAIEALPANALLLAPMVGLSHRAFRELVFGFGACDIAYGEMTSASGSAAASAFERAFLDTGPEPGRVVVQYLVTKAEGLAAALERLPPCRGVDLNFGCAAPHIERSGGGVRWMKDPAGAAALVSLAKRALQGRVGPDGDPLTVSAKLRAGYEDDQGALGEFCLALQGAGVDYLCVHPRLAGQKLRRRADWSALAALSRALRVPLVGNGDVRSFEDCLRLERETGVRGAMIGREAVRRPWIFELISRKRRDRDAMMEIDLADLAFRFIETLKARLPEEFWHTRAQRFFSYFCDNFTYAHHIKWKVLNAPTVDAMRESLEAYFLEVPSDAHRVDG
jgi:tRNA-dihydrouridine synthase